MLLLLLGGGNTEIPKALEEGRLGDTKQELCPGLGQIWEKASEWGLKSAQPNIPTEQKIGDTSSIRHPKEDPPWDPLFWIFFAPFLFLGQQDLPCGNWR